MAFQQILRSLFCRHSKAEFIANIYGDAIIEFGYKRSMWRCQKCGSIVYRDHLQHTDEQPEQID